MLKRGGREFEMFERRELAVLSVRVVCRVVNFLCLGIRLVFY